MDSKTSGAGLARSLTTGDLMRSASISVPMSLIYITLIFQLTLDMSNLNLKQQFRIGTVLSQRSIFYLLDHLHHTTTGYDGLPAWFLRLTAPVYSGTIAHLINQSIVQTHFPSQWKTSTSSSPLPRLPSPLLQLTSDPYPLLLFSPGSLNA